MAAKPSSWQWRQLASRLRGAARAVFASKGGPRLRLGRGGFARRCRRTQSRQPLRSFKPEGFRDRSFLAQHGRKATYEDRKLDRGYQELRARLRAVDTEHEREKDRVPLKPQRGAYRRCFHTAVVAARAAGGATAGDTTRRTGHTDDSGTRMPNLAEKEKMETFLAGVQAHVATNHNRAFLAAALGAEIAQTTMEYNPENLFQIRLAAGTATLRARWSTTPSRRAPPGSPPRGVPQHEQAV